VRPHNHLSTSSLHILPFHFHGHRDARHTCINSIRNPLPYSLLHFSSRLANSYPNTTPPYPPARQPYRPASRRILLLPPAPAPLQPASQDRAQTMFLLAPHPLPIIHRAHYHTLPILRHKDCQRCRGVQPHQLLQEMRQDSEAEECDTDLWCYLYGITG
jgi:hypothetical protein